METNIIALVIGRNIDIIESKGRAGAYGVTLKQNEKALQNYIESKGREGAYGRFDSIAFGDTSHVL